MMKKRMRKVLILNIVACLFLFNICSVYSYDYINERNQTPVELKREEIYQLKEMYDFLLDNQNNYYLLNYSGVCSTVTVEGDSAGTYTLDDYVAGVVKAEMGAERDKPEALKAQAIAARSFLLYSKKDSTTCTVGNGEFFQAFDAINPSNSQDQVYIDAAYETSGMVVMKDGEVAFTQYSSYSPNNTEINGKWNVTMYKYGSDPSSVWTWNAASKAEVKNANNYFHPTPGHSNGMSQALAGYLASKGQTYQQILETFYGVSGYSIGTISDGDYAGDYMLVDSDFGDIRYFNQGDYKNYYYSSNVNVAQYGSATIASHGCGPTSMAIILSSFEKRDITPITTTQRVCALGGCTSDGSYFWALESLAKEYGYKAQLVNRSDSAKVIAALESKNSLVVARMGPGTFTTGGHYIVLTGTRSDGYISVADPGSRTRTNQKWFTWKLILEQVRAESSFLIVTR